MLQNEEECKGKDYQSFNSKEFSGYVPLKRVSVCTARNPVILFLLGILSLQTKLDVEPKAFLVEIVGTWETDAIEFISLSPLWHD